MAEKLTYLSIAANDYQYYKASVKAGFKYNGLIIQGQQFIEKALKAILEIYDHDKDSDDFKTHNIKKLVHTVSRYTTVSNATDINLSNGYYFDVRYPGENYFEPDDSDFESMEIAVDATVVLLRKELSNHNPFIAAAYEMIW